MAGLPPDFSGLWRETALRWGWGDGVDQQALRWLLTQRERTGVDGPKGMALLKMELLNYWTTGLLDYWTAEKELALLGCDIAVVTIRPGALAGETWAWLDMPCATVK